MAAPAGAEPPAEVAAGPLPTADSLLTLEALERLVLERNPTLEAARQAASEAEARSRQAGSFGDPWLEGSIAPSSLSSSSERVGYGLQLRQEFGLFRRGPERDEARFDAQAAAADADAVAQEMLRLAGWAYADYAAALGGRQILEERFAILESMRRAALSRYAAGLVGAVDPLQAEGALAHVEHEQLVVARQLGVARARLNALLHRAGDEPLPPPAPLPPPTLHGDPEQTIAEALEKRPERVASAARRQAREKGTIAASREAAPDLALMLGYETYMDMSDFWPRVGLGVRLPLSFGRIGAKGDEARAAHARVLAERAAQEDEIRFEVREAHLRLVEEAHQYEQFEQTWLPVRERALEAARAGYEAGREDLLVVLQAEEDLAMSRLWQLQALAAYHRARADLVRASGASARGAEKEEGAP
jgi:cobalt-zinc-cadmium efflux system outer membrane protein